MQRFTAIWTMVAMVTVLTTVAGCGGLPQDSADSSSASNAAMETERSRGPVAASGGGEQSSTDSNAAASVSAPDGSQRRGPVAASSGSGGEQQQQSSGDASASASLSEPDGSQRRGPVAASSGSGGQQQQSSNDASASASLSEPGGGQQRGPVAASSGSGGQQSSNDASASASLTAPNAGPGDGNANSGQQAGNNSPPPGTVNPYENGGRSRPPAGSNYGNSGPPPGTVNPYANGGRSGPPAGSNYGNSGPPPGTVNPYANGGRSGPPAGSNYGNSGPPPGTVNPYANGGRSGPPAGSNYGNSGPPPGTVNPYANQEGGNSGSGRRGPEAAGTGGGGSTAAASQQSSGGGSAGGASMNLGSELGSDGGNQESGGGSAGGASLSLDGELGGASGGAPTQRPPAAPKVVQENSFYDMSMNAFARGDDLAGLQLLQAELSTNRSRYDEIPLGFWKETQSTTLGIRVGIGLSYAAPDDFGSKPPVIGDPAPEIGNQRGFPGGSSGPPSSFGGSSSVPKDAKGFLKYYAGDITDIILAQLDERFHGSPARYGSIGKLDVTPIIEIEAPERPNNSSAASRRGPVGVGSDGGNFSGSGQNDGPAEGFYPGLVFMGMANTSDLKKKAKQQELDLLIVLVQKVTVSRRDGLPRSETSAEFYTVLDGKKRGDTKTLYYQMVAGKRQQGETPVEDEIEKMFSKKIDRYFTVIDLPTLKEDVCIKQLERIAEKSKDNPLPFLCEANYFVHKGWLNEDVAQEKIIALVGEETALKIFSDDFETQKLGLQQWLPKPPSGR